MGLNKLVFKKTLLIARK